MFYCLILASVLSLMTPDSNVIEIRTSDFYDLIHDVYLDSWLVLEENSSIISRKKFKFLISLSIAREVTNSISFGYSYKEGNDAG